MKISKVDHTRAAVTAAAGKNRGIIYDNPKRGESAERDLDKRYDSLSNRAEGLYSILNPAKGKEEKQVSAFRKTINLLTKDILKISVKGEFDKSVNKQLRMLGSAQMSKYIPSDYSVSDDQVEGLIALSIRKSLRIYVNVNGERCYLPDILTEYLKGLKNCPENADAHEFRQLVLSVGEDKLKVFLGTVINDRIKPKRKDNTIKSIENQKVRVSLVEKDGMSLLAPSNAAHPKKGHVFSFMRAYAAGSEEDRKLMLIRMRTLLVQYLRGEGDIFDIQVQEKSFCNEITEEDVLDSKLKSAFDELYSQKNEAYSITKELASLSKEEMSRRRELDEKKAILVGQIRKTKVDISTGVDEALQRHFLSALCTVSNSGFLILDQNLFDTKVGLPQCDDYKISAEKFWLDFFDGEARKILLKDDLNMYKLELLWLGKKIWNNWTSYIAQKFIDYGKAVYHFALPEEFNFENGEVRFGEVLPKYRGGISSFEYERVKAKESLERSIAVSVTFAANTFSRAVLAKTPVKENPQTKEPEPANDILFTEQNVYSPCIFSDAGKRVMRYFGGLSSWKNNQEICSLVEMDGGIGIIEPIRLHIKSIRNESFHYMSAVSMPDPAVISKLFTQEEKQYSVLVRNKYYSNNVYRYYSEKDTAQLLNHLYANPSYVPAQIPAFDRLFNRESAYTNVKFLSGSSKSKIAGEGSDEVERFKGTLMFLLKQVYYRSFLQDGSCKNYFISKIGADIGVINRRTKEIDREIKEDYDEIKRITNQVKEETNNRIKNDLKKETKGLYDIINGLKKEKKELEKQKRALESFRTRVDAPGNSATLGVICQQIMTDYELQNRDKIVHKSGKNDNEIYKHFRSMLYAYLREAFTEYFLTSKKAKLFHFILEPEMIKNQKSANDYLSAWKCSTYRNLVKDDSMLKWYVLAHFLTPKQLNHLVGSFKSYSVYVNDIERRAGDTGNREEKDTAYQESAKVNSIIEILTFAHEFCARTTNVANDYFADYEEYASTLAKFIELDKEHVTENSAALKAFCAKEIDIEEWLSKGKKRTKQQRIGIYYDAVNPVINRNVLLALMYGDLGLLSAVCDKVKETDIQNYYNKQARLEKVFKSGACRSKKEQEELREFQCIKNYIEFNDLLSFSEMINDLNGQLVNWSYFRERDLMYLQLGVQYTKLFFTNVVSKDDFRRKVAGKSFSIAEGAVLYQIMAMYSFGLPLYGFNDKGNGVVSAKVGAAISTRIKRFIGSYCRGTDQSEAANTYIEGLFFFENIGEHEEIIAARDYIDHFKYYTDHKRSLLDLYSEVYERFFNYSVNYKKSVSYILPNILERYFVRLNTEMVRSERFAKAGYETSPHPVAGIRIAGIKSENLTYKIENQAGTKVIKVPARTQKYLETVERILNYSV